MVFQVQVHLQALQVAAQDLDLQVEPGEVAQVQVHLEVLALVVLDLVLPGVLALGVLVLDLNEQLCILVLVKCMHARKSKQHCLQKASAQIKARQNSVVSSHN